MYKIEQYGVYEKSPAHASVVNGVILAPFNSEKEAQEARITHGYNTDNYYVDKFKTHQKNK